MEPMALVRSPWSGRGCGCADAGHSVGAWGTKEGEAVPAAGSRERNAVPCRPAVRSSSRAACRARWCRSRPSAPCRGTRARDGRCPAVRSRRCCRHGPALPRRRPRLGDLAIPVAPSSWPGSAPPEHRIGRNLALTPARMTLRARRGQVTTRPVERKVIMAAQRGGYVGSVVAAMVRVAGTRRGLRWRGTDLSGSLRCRGSLRRSAEALLRSRPLPRLYLLRRLRRPRACPGLCRCPCRPGRDRRGGASGRSRLPTPRRSTSRPPRCPTWDVLGRRGPA